LRGSRPRAGRAQTRDSREWNRGVILNRLSIANGLETQARGLAPQDRIDSRVVDSTESAARIVVVLPRYRLWQWHRVLLDRLARSYDVEVLLDDRARPYPLAQRLWLRLERAVLNCGSLSKPLHPEGRRHSGAQVPSHAERRIINLSEYPVSGDTVALHYKGSSDSQALIGRLMAGEAPMLALRNNEGEVLAASRVAIEDKASLARGLQSAFSRCIVMIERAIEQPQRRDAAIGDEREVRPGSLSAFISRAIRHKASNAITMLFRHRDHWQVALRGDKGQFQVVADDGRRYYADPFLLRRDGRTFLFVEEYIHAERKGSIAVAEVIGDRLAASPVPVLSRPYHLSYPHVFEADGEILMIPETGENRTLELYRATEFPLKWELVDVLMKDGVYSDATPVFHQGRWWLFVTVDVMGKATQDELSIFHSDAITGPWMPHAANPVKSDSRSSRSGGRIIKHGDRLFRPAQDCDRHYGTGLVWFEITELMPTRFSERKVLAWDALSDLGAIGLHSFDELGGIQAIDFQHSVGLGSARRATTACSPRKGSALERSLSSGLAMGRLLTQEAKS
jgi:hypothetical protein